MAILAENTRRAWLYVWIISIGGFVYGIDAGGLSGIIAMSKFVRDFGERNSKTGKYAFSANMLLAFNFPALAAASLASLTSGTIGDRFGRRGGMTAMGICAIIGAALQLSANAVGQIIAGKIVVGMAFGYASSFISLYLGEMSPTKSRGSIVGMYEFSVCIGQILAGGLNWATNSLETKWAYRGPFLLCLVPPVIQIFAIWLVPESPRWLILKGRNKDAEKAIRKIRGPKYPEALIVDEVELISVAIEEERQLAKSDSEWMTIFQGTNRTRTLVPIFMFFFQQYAGVSFLTSYGTYFFKLAGLTNAFLLQFVLNLLGLIGAGLALPLAKYAGRRPIMIYGGILQAACMLIFAIIGVADPGSNAARKCLGAFTLLFSFVNHVTWQPFGYIITSEIPSTELRAKTFGFTTGIKWAFQMSMSGWLPYAINSDKGNLGAKMGFIFGPIIAIGTVWMYFYIPETRGLTLEDIDDLYVNKIPARKSAGYKSDARVAREAAAANRMADFGDEKVEIHEQEMARV